MVRKAPRLGGQKVSCDHSILVVEDDLAVAKQYLETFERLGVEKLHLATDLATAHQICDSNRLSGVLMDFCLSGGRDTLHLGSVLRRRKIPFIVISGYSPEDIFRGFRPDGYMQKPVGTPDFERTVCRLFKISDAKVCA